MAPEAEELRKGFNSLAEKYGWKTITKSQARMIGKERISAMIGDLLDCVKAGLVGPIQSDIAKFDGNIIRKAYPAHRREI